MAFKAGDKVKLRLSKETLDRLNLVGAPINNKLVTIGQVYAMDYEPDQSLYMVDLDEPIEHEGVEIDEIYDLRDVDLELIDVNEPLEERVMRFGRFINERLEDSKWYVGIADCRGVESFIEEPHREEHLSQVDRLHDLGLVEPGAPTRKDITKGHNDLLSILSMRCMYNQQRHPVVYRVLLSDSSAEHIQDLVDSGEYEEALIAIKDMAEEVQLAKSIGGGNLEKRWKMIPNPDLDPFN